MELLDFTPELLDEIISWSMPAGFESLALSCKTVYMRCESRIRRHNALKKRWSRAINVGSRGRDTLRLIHEIAKDPLIARYITSLCLWGRPKDVDPMYLFEELDVDFRHDKAAVQQIKDLILGSPIRSYLQEAGVKLEEWWEQFLMARSYWIYPEQIKVPDLVGDKPTKDNEEYAFVSLLFLLPNLKSVTPHGSWNDVDWSPGSHETQFIFPVLDALVKASNNSTWATHPLGSLETVFPWCHPGYERKTRFDHIQWFAQLPSAKTVYVTSCTATDPFMASSSFSWRNQAFSSNITRLEFAFCCVNANNISNLLSHMPKLQVFKYSHEIKQQGQFLDWDAGPFVDAVAKHCGTTIIELAVTLNNRTGHIESGVTSFHNFKKLKRLEIDLQILCGPPADSRRRLGYYGRVLAGVEKWGLDDLSCLATLLPTSLEAFIVYIERSEHDERALEVLLKGFREERARRLPDLEKLLFRQWYDDSSWSPLADKDRGNDKIRSLVQDAGCELEAYLPQHQISHHRDRKERFPLWIREFEDKVGGVVYGNRTIGNVG